MKRLIALRAEALLLSLLLCGCGSAAPSSVTAQSDSLSDTASSASVPIVTESAEETSPAVTIPAETEPLFPDPAAGLDASQKNSIAMLNYLTVLTQEINASKNSRMFLEEAYTSLLNNMNPEKVSELTQYHLGCLLDQIETYRMISVKRDRLRYLYEQNQAKALRAAIPNPLGLMTAVKAKSKLQIIASVLFMAADSVSSYASCQEEIKQEFLQDGWALDEEEAANLHDTRKAAFLFMIDMVRENELPGTLALSEESVDSFVEWSNAENLFQKQQFLESEQSVYAGFAGYWMELADTYYRQEQYEKCLEAAAIYEALQADIFRRDFCFARIIPELILSAEKIYPEEDYIAAAETYLQVLMENTSASDWSLRYFAAQVYLDLYEKTGNPSYQDTAFDIAQNNVNMLIPRQQELNAQYLSEIPDSILPEDATKEAKKQAKSYQKFLKKKRETECAPVYEPLILNCDLLFALAKERGCSKEEQTQIEGMLRDSGPLFLAKPLENRYSFSPQICSCDGVFEKDTLILPASLVSEISSIRVTIQDGIESSVYPGWTVKKAKRPAETFDSFLVVFENEEIQNHTWSEDAVVTAEIRTDAADERPDVKLQFRVSEYTDLPGSLIDTVIFEQVK